jgi:8-oxo-dGTP pyrophosphatase MutT (NUDIX family)
MEKVLARGGHMWNGEIYTLENIISPGDERIVLRMSTCEYKDLVFRMLKGDEHVARRFGESLMYQFSGVNCAPLTLDGKFVFGIRADRPEQGAPPIGGIGGTLNKDEMEIHSFVDIRQCMLREIQEETALECPPEALKFFGLYSSDYSHHFWFTLRLPVHSQDINQYHRPGEFSSLVAYTQQEAFETTLRTTRSFLRWRPYLHLLPQVTD